ncbi:MAG: 4-hydroxy-tetrahydrodipicolinate synthase [Eggerthellaceae bacterium]|nr:4-hydroxy-tetrahydrodipicolinate synthase [Eggerthellaceae bacterium]
MAEPRFGRLITAMITPFDENRDIDLKRTDEFVNRLIEGGTDSIIVCGTTGESPTVFYPQKIEVIRRVIEAADGRVPIIANVGDNCTADTIDFAADVSKLGVDGFMCVVPYYNKPPQEGLYQHFKAIAQSTDLPIILYNIPGRCVVNMKAETTLRLANELDNIVAIKEASGDIEQVKAIVAGAPEGFSVYSGDDSFTYPLMQAGGVGVISTISNVATARMKEIVDLCAAGKWDEATEANERLLPLMNGLFETTNPILVKEALALDGFPVGGVRLPLVDATPEQSERLASIMREVGVL